MTVTDINSKTPKADVLAAYQALAEEHEAFKQNVVTNALDAARKNDWCDVVNKTLIKMGLEDLLPDVFSIQYKAYAGSASTWYTIDNNSTSEAEAIARAKKNRREIVDNMRKQFEHVQKLSATQTTRSESVTIGENCNINALLARLKERHEKLIAKELELEEFEVPTYPKYRVVVRSPRGKIIKRIDVKDD